MTENDGSSNAYYLTVRRAIIQCMVKPVDVGGRCALSNVADII